MDMIPREHSSLFVKYICAKLQFERKRCLCNLMTVGAEYALTMDGPVSWRSTDWFLRQVS